MIEINNISKVFRTSEVETVALNHVNLDVKEGEFVAIMGPSGCGKSTLLNILGLLDNPTEGSYKLLGQEVADLKEKERTRVRKGKLGFVFQSFNLIDELNVYENVELPLTYLGVKAGERKRMVEDILKRMNISHRAKHFPQQLSGGQQQRVAIARAIVCEPKVLLLDEPLGALDLKMRKEMQLELKAIHRNVGITFVYVTHDQEEALTMSDKIVVVNDGVIQQIGTPKKIYDEPSNAFVADFIGESNILSGLMIKDFKVCFLDTLFDCEDKGFAKNEPVDLVIRPEDITIYRDGVSGQLGGKVVSSVFKGTWYEMEIECNGYEFTVQSTVEAKPGDEVRLGVTPDGIHIMKKLRTVNTFKGEVEDESTVRFCGGSFEVGTHGLQKGDTVNVSVPFDAVELTDDEEDGVIGANVTQILYKGTYYQVQIYTDTDEDFYIDTTDEWDIDDRVGVKVLADKIKVEKAEETEDEEV